jgi:hypothetical protein
MDANDPGSNYTFVQGYNDALSAGVRAGTVHVDWNSDEGPGSGPAHGIYSDYSSQLVDSDGYYAFTVPASKVSLTVSPIDTTGYMLPSDLSGSALDSAIVIGRFTNYIAWVFSMMPHASFTSIQIGNEIDLPPAASASVYWTRYKTFLSAVVPYIHSIRPGIKVGVTVSLYGLINGGVTVQSGILSLLGSVDVIGLTYYPIDSTTFQDRDPSVVASDLSQVFALVGSTPVYLQEAGYPTSASCGGSDASQAQFIHNLFAAWDSYQSRMPFVALLRLNDYSYAGALAMAGNYGLSGNAAFVAYLETLGLRTYAPSAPKTAWEALTSETAMRQWQ